MKKNKMMRLASVLLVLTLLSTSVISGTFAKYITQDSDTDSARVAKWGVTVDVAVDGAFAAEYAADTTVTDSQGVAIAKTVVAANGDNLLAPGTQGDLLAGASISGTPEVAVKVTKSATLTLTNWKAADGSYYCPLTIVVTTNGVPKTFNGMDYAGQDNPVAAFTNAVISELNDVAHYAPNTNLGVAHSVTWAWEFENGEGQTNAKDTDLGNAANATIDFSYSIIVEQVD